MKTDKKLQKSTFCASPFASRTLLIFVTLLIAHSSLLFGVDFSLRPKAFVSIPLGEGNIAEDGNARYGMGGGGELGFEVDLSTIWPNPLGLGYTFGIEGALQINALQGDNPANVSFYSFGGAAGLYFFPLSRLFTRIDGAVGTYLSARDAGNSPGRSAPGLFWRGGAEIGFRFTPGFTLAANTGWRQFTDSEIIRNSGMYAGLTAQLSFQTGSSANREGVGASLDQYGEMYPVFMQSYQTSAIGSVVLRNNENSEIRNVRLFFRAAGYTASEFPCGAVSIIPRGRSTELPLYADFSPEVLNFTDTGRIVGELVVRYTFLGQERETVRAITLATHNRNMITTGDAAALAAFISPTSPETLDFARFIAGLSRANNRTGHNQNMQYGIWLLEGLRASNIRLGETYTNDNEAQYPAETLSYRTGSSRDLALLYAAVLEGVGISSALISMSSQESGGGGELPGGLVAGNSDGEFLVAVNLGVNQSAAETMFNGTDKILIVDNEVWLPLSMSAINEGFMACWTQGVKVLNKVFTEEMDAEFIIVEKAWVMYPPAPLPELRRSIIRTNNEAATNEVNRAVRAYINQEIEPLIRRVSGEPGAGSSAALQNRLGILYSRAGRIAEGKAAYERAAGMGSVPAMTNRGNLALAENDLSTAERWFRQVLQRDPENKTALRGMERVQGNR